MNIIDFSRIFVVLFSLSIAGWLYNGKKDGAGWFIFFAILVACRG